ncbi:MAG: deoxyuridine 5'-triphosphate nucleotidohydrolase [Candidatus Syntrophoarchaeum caldarius]|uniref:Probable deoxyuridine 5'-triphosphate nucleotidohydrolase n=1 Tax=Candidatus Syntropharchaeum caldarium TaxID=1838285 RepID=A0A1F2PBL7_9EURY|nr:MAG: deoxyuridine 5'-triphosphate nucleotidohydrolase [Candidatus Syntrophoarchaeum caldarius]
MAEGVKVLSGPNMLKLVENMIDPELQIQPNGVDLTLMAVEKIVDSGSVDFDNSDRRISKSVRLFFDEDDWIMLESGAYKVIFNEIVTIPLDYMAIAFPRSSLLRCGATIETAVWDAGYRGRSEALLLVMNPAGLRLKRDARILQMVFLKLQDEVREDEAYKGIYQFENE